ncbi:TerC/Alx family metal homeostasis membrane protein [Flavobacteriaceae bacterium F08102]|nr:TerC/Alx family metal homeostasis membrane protein [Flavobacteriaceae bacterium F08102]
MQLSLETYLPWIILISYILLLLGIDFFILHKKDRVPSVKKALFESLFFVLNALIFAGIIYWLYQSGLAENSGILSPQKAFFKYLTGYVIELSLSVDNLFVIAVIFANYKVPLKYQHKLLFLGILGALILRAILIGLGLILLHQFEVMTIIFGLFLLFTAFKMLKPADESTTLSEPKGFMKLFRFSNTFNEGNFTTQIAGKKFFTPLMAALITIEFTDLIFALDSIPAIFSITTDPYIVYSSNIFAIMGLRSLFFFLSNMLEKFAYLKYAVFTILLFVALKLILTQWVAVSEIISLLFILITLVIGIYVSIHKKKN